MTEVIVTVTTVSFIFNSVFTIYVYVGYLFSFPNETNEVSIYVFHCLLSVFAPDTLLDASRGACSYCQVQDAHEQMEGPRQKLYPPNRTIDKPVTAKMGIHLA